MNSLIWGRIVGNPGRSAKRKAGKKFTTFMEHLISCTSRPTLALFPRGGAFTLKEAAARPSNCLAEVGWGETVFHPKFTLRQAK